jgi:hypothetical protein
MSRHLLESGEATTDHLTFAAVADILELIYQWITRFNKVKVFLNLNVKENNFKSYCECHWMTQYHYGK